MCRKVLKQAVLTVWLSAFAGQVFSGVCATSDGLLFSSTEKTVSKYSYLSSGCLDENSGSDTPSRRGNEAMQLQLYDDVGVASIALDLNSPAQILPASNTSDHYYSLSISHSLVNSIDFREEIGATANHFNIDPLLLHAIAYVESRHNPNAVSSAGAKGLMQVMPATAKQYGLADPEQLFDPVENLRISSIYLRNLYNLFGNNLDLVLAAYNAGENAVIKYGYQIPPYDETQKYVRLVKEKYQEFSESRALF